MEPYNPNEYTTQTEFVQPDTISGDIRKAAEAETAALPEPSLGEVVGAAFHETALGAIISNTFGERFKPDLNYAIDETEFNRLTEGIPSEFHKEFVQARSQGEADHIRSELQAKLERESVINRAGGLGTAAVLGGNVVDPINWISGGAGAFTQLGKASRLGRMVLGGTHSAALNATIEQVIAENQVGHRDADTVNVALFGFVLGAPLAGLSRYEADAMSSAALRAVREVDSHTIANTPALKELEMQRRREAAQKNLAEGDEEFDYDAYQQDESGSFVQSGSVGAAQARAIEADEFGTVGVKIPFLGKKINIPLRFDWYHKLATSEYGTARRMAKDFLADPVFGARNQHNVSEMAEFLKGTWKGRFHESYSTGFNEYAKRAAVPMLKRMDAQSEFAEAVTAVVRGNAEAASRFPEAVKVANTLKQLHADTLEAAKKYGVEGAESVMPDPSYMMRRFAHHRIAGLVEEFGEKEIGKLIGKAIRAVRDDIDDVKALRIGEKYIKVVRKLPMSSATFGRSIDTQDTDLFKEMLETVGLTADEIDLVMGVMKKPDGGMPEGDHARFKHRTLMDENFFDTLTAKNGTQRTVRVTDLLENDSRVLFEIYGKQMSGLVAFARMGIKGEKDWKARMAELEAEQSDRNLDPEKYNALVKDFENIRSLILGRPLSNEPFGKMERMLRVLRDVNFFRMMGQVGFAQSAEIGNTIGLAGWKAASQHIPAVKDLMEMAKKGLIPDDLARDIMNIGGFGTEAMSNHPVLERVGDRMFDQTLTGVEELASKAKYATANLSGLIAVNNVLRQFVARAFIQKFTDFAHGIGKLDDAALKKLTTAGIHEGNIDGVFNGIKKFVEREEGTGKVIGIDFEEWARVDPDSMEAFQLGVWREARRAVQEHTIGETHPWMHTIIGQILTQFRAFTLVSYGKQFLYGANHMDMQTASAWFLSSVFGGLAYAAQTSLNYAHDSSELEKRLDPVEVFKAGIARSSWSSLMPAAVDTLGKVTTGDTFFSNSRTTGLSSNLLLGNPTVDLLNKAAGFGTDISNEIFAGSEHEFTKSDIRGGLGLIIPNYVGARNLVHGISSQFPTTSDFDQQQ